MRGDEATDADALCSRGAINVYVAPYRITYKGLLLRAEKRLSRGWHLRGSYALSRNAGTNAGNGFNLDNWLENTGPVSSDFTQVVNVAGVTRLPGRVDLGLNFGTERSAVQRIHRRRRPQWRRHAARGGVDRRPAAGHDGNAFNRGMGRADLERLVDEFNRSYTGTAVATLQLPARYAFGDNFHSLDVRLSRTFGIGQRLGVSLIGEAFNVYNASNLSGYSGDLTAAGFGQPTSRVSQVFGSADPGVPGGGEDQLLKHAEGHGDVTASG